MESGIERKHSLCHTCCFLSSGCVVVLERMKVSEQGPGVQTSAGRLTHRVKGLIFPNTLLVTHLISTVHSGSES